MAEEPKKKKKKILPILLVVFLTGFASVSLWLYSDSFFGNGSQELVYSQATPQSLKEDSSEAAQLKNPEVSPICVDMQADEQLIMSDSVINDTTAATKVNPKEPNSSIINDNTSPLSIRGKRINIAVIGVDGRLGTNTKHADANHLISILPDSGIVQIFSVPRDTPAEAKMPDTSGLNKLTIVYANRGLKSYLKELSRITGVGEIPYYMEVGFSQAMGIIELLGFKDSKATLQVLRSRKGLGGDDYQRCYNQGQFIRQAILSHFKRLDGVMGDILIRGGLKFSNTNITPTVANQIVGELKKVNFPQNPNTITVHVRPRMRMKFKVYDFTNAETFTKLQQKIEHFNQWNNDGNGMDGASEQRKLVDRLRSVLRQAKKDTLTKPASTIRALARLFEQRAWMQVSNLATRDSMRHEFATLLIAAYTRQKKIQQAQEVKATLEMEKKLFETTKSK